jgi:Rrf2 family protein
MLRLSKRGEYGVRAMFEIAKNYGKGPITIKEIAGKQEVPIPYLEQLLNRLRREGLIDSVRGPGGGYVLKRNPKDISMGEVLKILEGPVALSECLNPALVDSCNRINACVTRLLWKQLGETIDNFLKKTTLKDLCNEDLSIKDRKGTKRRLI